MLQLRYPISSQCCVSEELHSILNSKPTYVQLCTPYPQMGMDPKAPIKPNMKLLWKNGGPIYTRSCWTIKWYPPLRSPPENLGIPTRKVILKALILRGYVDYVGFREAKSPREMYKQFIIHVVFFAGPSDLWSFAAFPCHFEEPLHIPTSLTSNIRYIGPG